MVGLFHTGLKEEGFNGFNENAAEEIATEVAGFDVRSTARPGPAGTRKYPLILRSKVKHKNIFYNIVTYCLFELTELSFNGILLKLYSFLKII